MIKIGIIGMSEGNGHPYSWAAIFNGYDKKYMNECPFPVIPEYLSKKEFPKDQINGARVTHIWTQSKSTSEHIAKASKIEFIVDKPENLIQSVDAILLARDDYQRHYEMAKIFINAGLPIYIDKPIAITVEDTNKTYTPTSFHQRFTKWLP
jgi:predicted dehydrogenase